jgi:hypothetical protein
VAGLVVVVSQTKSPFGLSRGSIECTPGILGGNWMARTYKTTTYLINILVFCASLSGSLWLARNAGMIPPLRASAGRSGHRNRPSLR